MSMKRFIVISAANGWHGEPPDIEVDATFDNDESVIGYVSEGQIVIDTLENRQGGLVDTYEKIPHDGMEAYHPFKPQPTSRIVTVFAWADIEEGTTS